ncbi:c-type cytochrome biogenesis protein CcmI [Methylobacter sp. S3L5C]|uniref:c-type cytochrome biogenesis protein CcmI n=1 Tax=Methylobacter sp. S3L5C TaxID=2839024 RepID=UPI001FAE2E41|nr:c-type cytochrome biogenesis protein CcmI [Methylobacter sp. S3L5C]
MLFLLIVSILILIAFLLILPPLWRKQSAQATDLDQRNILIAQNRLAELKESRQSGALSQAQYDDQLADLEQALSDDLEIKSHVTSTQSQGRWLVYVLVLGIPLLAGSLYLSLGNYQAISHSAEMAIDPDTLKLAEVNKMVAGLAEKMKATPDDAKGWIMLGRSYKALEQYPKAVEAFANAYRLLGDQVDIMLLYADAIAYASDKNLAGKPTELVFKALALEPDNMNALWLGGMAKAQQGDPATAIKLWRKLAALLPPESDAQKEINALLAKIESESPQAVAQSEASQAANVADVAITVKISMAPELQKLTSPSDTVFVYAQALSGPKMPLAIVRKQVSDLPLTVSLNDAMAMMPNMKLSNFAQVKLLARISKSGNAMSQLGDLIGVIDQVALTDKNEHMIVINDVVK